MQVCQYTRASLNHKVFWNPLIREQLSETPLKYPLKKFVIDLEYFNIVTLQNSHVSIRVEAYTRAARNGYDKILSKLNPYVLSHTIHVTQFVEKMIIGNHIKCFEIFLSYLKQSDRILTDAHVLCAFAARRCRKAFVLRLLPLFPTNHTVYYTKPYWKACRGGDRKIIEICERGVSAEGKYSALRYAVHHPKLFAQLWENAPYLNRRAALLTAVRYDLIKILERYFIKHDRGLICEALEGSIRSRSPKSLKYLLPLAYDNELIDAYNTYIRDDHSIRLALYPDHEDFCDVLNKYMERITDYRFSSAGNLEFDEFDEYNYGIRRN